MIPNKRRIIISAVFDLIYIIACAWYFNFAIGAPLFSFECILYSLVTAFVITSFSFLFVSEKLNFKKYFFKKIFVKVFLIICAVQFVMYKPMLLIMFFLV